MCLTITELIHPWQCSISSQEYGVQAGKICNPEAHLSSINASFHIPQRPSFVWGVELIRTEWSDSRKCKAVISSSITENFLIWWRPDKQSWASSCCRCWSVWIDFTSAMTKNSGLRGNWVINLNGSTSAKLAELLFLAHSKNIQILGLVWKTNEQ